MPGYLLTPVLCYRADILLFDVEMVFIIPWATIFGSHELIAADARWGKLTLIEMFVFMGILILGLVYVWRKGDLNWIKPDPGNSTYGCINPFIAI
jgi:NADH:ubiquinone oxidoreductase subunit 3 (subunit A)